MREIRFLLHFTQIRNLPSIIQHGILPRNQLYEASFHAYAGAEYRLDGDDRVVSLSISAASKRIFNAKMKETAHSDWIIFFLNPNILWTYNCRFCFRNAATRAMRKHQGYLGGQWALEQMFSDTMASQYYNGTNYRSETDIPTFLTTDPDAEVQVQAPGGVAPETIIGAWVCCLNVAEAVQNELNLLPGLERDVIVAEFGTFSNGYSEWVLPECIL